MIGKRFGSLVVIEKAESRRGKHRLKCLCDCGREHIAQKHSISTGRTTRCKTCSSIRHGGVGTSEYKVWIAMRQRCNNPSNHAYKDYGHRGIAVCNRWESFSLFIADMGKRPTDKHEIDRIDNDGNYEPGNCRWATRRQQTMNTRRAIILEHNGKSQPLSIWAEEIGVKYDTLYYRIRRGMDAATALTL